MRAELLNAGAMGTKRNAKGYQTRWQGDTFHLDVSAGDIPISRLLTSASRHDSQASLPLSEMSDRRVDYGYELMDAADDCSEIHQHAVAPKHVALIDPNPAAIKHESNGWPPRLGHEKRSARRIRRRNAINNVPASNG